MKRTALFFFLLALLLQACGDDGKGAGRLTGRWLCDAEATFDLIEETRGMDADQRAAGVSVLRTMALDIDNASKMLVVHTGRQIEKDSYSLKERKKNIYLIRIKDDSATFELRDDNTLVVSDSKKRSVIFKRQL